MGRLLFGIAGALVVLAVCVRLVFGPDLKGYRVPSGGMEPTVKINGRIVVDRGAYDDAAPARGEIVAFHPPAAAESGDISGACAVGVRGAPCARPRPGEAGTTFVKRVVGVGGDRIAFRAGQVVRDGRDVAEHSIRGCQGAFCDLPRAIVVPRGSVFVVGDARGDSFDSREFGPVPASYLIGRVDDCNIVLALGCHARH